MSITTTAIQTTANNCNMHPTAVKEKRNCIKLNLILQLKTC